MTTATGLMFVFLLGAPVSADPRQPPSLAGHWVMLNPDPASAQIPPICRLECVIVQEGKWLTVKTPAGEVLRSYDLTGAAVTDKSVVAGRTVEWATTARWEGSALVVDRTRTSDPGGAPVRLRIFLDEGRLVFERTWPGTGRGSPPAKFLYERRERPQPSPGGSGVPRFRGSGSLRSGSGSRS